MTVEVKGMAELKKNLATLENFFGVEVKDALVMGGLLVETEAKKSIQEVGMGTHVIRYRNGGSKKSHIAAKPGIAPNTDTGALVRSVVTEIKGDSVFVGSSLEYAAYLEFGTLNKADGSEHNAARPFLQPALEANKGKIKDLFAEAVKDAVRKTLRF